MKDTIMHTVKSSVVKAASMVPFGNEAMLTVKKLKESFSHAGAISGCQNSKVKGWLEQVEKDGFCVIPNFYDDKKCAELVAEIERVQEEHLNYVQTDSAGSDHRLFGINTASKLINDEFHNEPQINLASKIYYGTAVKNAFTLGAKMVYTKNNAGSGGGWHRDSYARQIKAIVYLSDVTEKNGPFQYIKGSHTYKNALKQMKFLKHSVQNVRQTHEEVTDLVKAGLGELIEFNAPKGTLVLADVSGIHRGKPIEEGHRYALTNYFMMESTAMDDKTYDRFEPVLRHK